MSTKRSKLVIEAQCHLEVLHDLTLHLGSILSMKIIFFNLKCIYFATKALTSHLCFISLLTYGKGTEYNITSAQTIKNNEEDGMLISTLK